MFFATPEWDLYLFTLINQTGRNGIFNMLMPLFSSRIVLGILAIWFMVWVARRYTWRRLWVVALLLAALGTTDAVCKYFKDTYGRVRPLNQIASTHFIDDGAGMWAQRPVQYGPNKLRGSSYVSAHAANSAVLGILLALLFAPLRPWVLIIPLCAGYSRVYLGKHFPSDVLAGWMVGAMVAGTYFLAYDLLRSRWKWVRAGCPPMDDTRTKDAG